MNADIRKGLIKKGLDIKELGLSTQLCGMVVSSRNSLTVVYFPDETNFDDDRDLKIVATNADEFKEIVYQMDVQEVEIIEGDNNKKVLVRKSQRNMDSRIIWEVLRRDNITCRYCGADDVPMTYDHIKLWESKGETSKQNGLCTCRKCNKTRGSMEYDEWIASPYYRKRSEGLTPEVIKLNLELVTQYKEFPDKISKRSR